MIIAAPDLTRDRGRGKLVGGALSLTLLTACGSQVVDGSPTARPRWRASSMSAGNTERGDLRAFCDAVDRGAHTITQSHGDLHVVLHSFNRMNAVAPAAVEPDTSYVVNAIRRAFAMHRVLDLAVLGRHTHAVARWSAAHCLGV